MKNYCKFLLLIIFLNRSATAQTYDWVRQMGSPGGDVAAYVKITTQNGLYVAGNVDGLMQLTSNSIAYSGGFIAKYDSAGLDQWIIPIGDLWPGYINYSTRSPAIAVDDFDNVYVSAYYQDSTSVGNTQLPDTGTNNCVLAKVSPAGWVIWSRKIATNSYLPAISLDRSGNIIVAGRITGIADFDGNVLVPYGSSASPDVVLAKYNSTGTLQWVKQAGGSGFYGDEAQCVGTDHAGNIYIGGDFRSASQFDALTITPVNFATYDGFIAKYDAAGNAQWVKHAGHECTTLVVDSAGNCYTGGAISPGDFEGISFPSGGGAGMYVAKLNASGTYQWIRHNATITGNLFAITTGLALGADNSCYGTGLFSDSLIIDNLVLTSFIDPPCTAGYRINSFLLKLDSAGNALWGKSTPSCHSASNGYAVDVKGCTIAASGIIRNAPAAVYFDSDSLVAGGGYDGFVYKLTECIPTVTQQMEQPDKLIAIYPDPFTSQIFIDVKDDHQNNITLSLHDITGRFVLNNINVKPNQGIDLTFIQPGVYFVKVCMNGQCIVKKIVRR